MKASSLVSFSVVFLASSFVNAANPKTELQQWIEKQSQSQSVAAPDSLNLGLSLFEETQFRMETDQNGVFSKQEVRMTLKPLWGMANERAMVDQQQSLKKLYLEEGQAQNLLMAYRQVLQAWRILQLKKAFDGSQMLFQKAKGQLSKYSQSSREQTLSLVSDLTFYFENKETVDIYSQKLGSVLGDQKVTLTSQIQSLKFLTGMDLKNWVEKLPDQHQSNIEKEQQQLEKMRYDQKKIENYRLLKFVSMSRERGARQIEDYQVQLAFKIPFLSDSLELEEAKTNFLQKSQKLKISEIQKQNEYNDLLASLSGAIEKQEILKWAPQKSFGQMKVTGQLGTLAESVKSEVQILKVRVASVENQAKIMDLYLQILAFHNRLKNSDGNLLSQLPKP